MKHTCTGSNNVFFIVALVSWDLIMKQNKLFSGAWICNIWSFPCIFYPRHGILLNILCIFEEKF